MNPTPMDSEIKSSPGRKASGPNLNVVHNYDDQILTRSPGHTVYVSYDRPSTSMHE